MSRGKRDDARVIRHHRHAHPKNHHVGECGVGCNTAGDHFHRVKGNRPADLQATTDRMVRDGKLWRPAEKGEWSPDEEMEVDGRRWITVDHLPEKTGRKKRADLEGLHQEFTA